MGGLSLVVGRSGEEKGLSEGQEKLQLKDLNNSQIGDLMKELSRIRKQKYVRSKETKYGNLNRGFTDGELRRFLSCCTHKKANLAFTMQAYLGLRVGEVVKVNLCSRSRVLCGLKPQRKTRW